MTRRSQSKKKKNSSALADGDTSTTHATPRAADEATTMQRSVYTYGPAAPAHSASSHQYTRRATRDIGKELLAEPLAFQQQQQQQLFVDPNPDADAAVEVAMDIADLFAPPPPLPVSSLLQIDAVDAVAVSADFHFDFDDRAKRTSAAIHDDEPMAIGASSPSPSDASSTATMTMSASTMVDHSSCGTDSENVIEAASLTFNPSSLERKSPSASVDANRQEQPEEDLLEVRRKRNRESMRRVRLRKRDAKLNTQQTVDELEAKLQQLMAKNQHAATQLSARGDHALTLAPHALTGKPSYPELLSEKASLSYENKHLRDSIKTFQVFEASMARMVDDDRLQQRVQSEEEALNEDAEILKPLLSWLKPADLSELIALAAHKIQENKALVESIVQRPNNALGWSDQRCIEGLMARYLLQKTFHHETVESLAHKTWETIVDIEKLAQVMRWAKGMKILHWLSDDAAVVTRELTIPNPLGPDFPTRFRFTLLVFKAKTADGGYCLGTINLNIYGTSVDECLQKDVTYQNGMNAHTMYGWTFSRARCRDTGKEIGCHVELAGLTGNGTHAYAHNVLMEMVTVVLLWENAFVASIRLLKT